MKRLLICILTISLILCSCASNNSSISENSIGNTDSSKNGTQTATGTVTNSNQTSNSIGSVSISTKEIELPEEKTTTKSSTTTTTTTTATTQAPSNTTTTVNTTSSSKPVTTTKNDPPPEPSPEDLAIFKLTPIKAKYKSSATAFACVEMILSYYGYSSSQADMVSCLDIDEEIWEANGAIYGPDPSLVFAGNPSTTIYGSMGFPIYCAVEKYFSQNNFKMQCLNISNSSINAIMSIIEENGILIVWMSDTKSDYHNYYDKDLIDYGTFFPLPKNIKCMAVIGLTPESVILADPTQGKIIKMPIKEYEEKAIHESIAIIKQS